MPASTLDQRKALALVIEPAVVWTSKSHWMWTAIWVGGAILTLGILPLAMPRDSFINRFASAVGPWIGFPDGWGPPSPRCVIHEATHVTWFVAAGWLFPVVGWFFGRRVRAVCGIPFMAIGYGLLILPVMGAIFRVVAELHPEVRSLRLTQHPTDELRLLGVLPNTFPEAYGRITRFAETVGGSAYGWPLPRAWVVALFQWAFRRWV